MNSVKNKSVKSKVLSIISTVLYVVLLLLLVFALIANLSKKDNQISGLFGFSFAVVQSGSMIDGGFDVGDMVLIKSVNTDTLKKDDIIVFYKYKDPADNQVLSYVQAHKITDEISAGTYQDTVGDDSVLNRGTTQNAVNANSMLVFHRIVDIYVDQYGERFFETKGDSNGVKDDILIREDFVCAVYVGSSPFIQDVLQFVTSPTGLCVVILLPILLTIGLQIFSFMSEVRGTTAASKLLSRKLKYKDVDFTKIKVAEYLSEPEKVYLYDITDPEDKLNLAIILWDEGVEEALEVYEKDREKFYQHFFDKFSKSETKKLKFLKIKADLVKQNPEISEEDIDRQAKVIYKEEKEKKSASRNNDNA
ncbi:MAG: hypothetical protein IJF22_00285 [Clostridia bacterium]|nr:hypothetical protein [Clostridia bacterium]